MKKISILVFIICNLFSVSSFTQTKDTITIAYISVYNYDILPSSIEKYPVFEKSDFEGSYHFGDSEGESNLDILYSNDKFFARTEYAIWGEDNSRIGISERLNIEAVGDKIIIDDTEYELAVQEEEDTKGLKSILFEEIEDKINRFIQFNPGNEIEKPEGKYPETSFVKLTQLELMQYSKSDLKIIRNEIFARNGYAFKQDGEMDKFFSTKAWYVSLKKTSKLNLNDIETHNINLIRKLEQQ